MKVTFRQFRQAVAEKVSLKAVKESWGRWRVSARGKDLNDFSAHLGKALKQPGSEAPVPAKPIVTRKPSRKPEEIIVLPYSKDAFDVECNWKTVPSRYGKKLSKYFAKLEKLCLKGGGDYLEAFDRIYHMKDLALDLTNEVKGFKPGQKFLAVSTGYNQGAIVKDTALNRLKYRLSSTKAEKCQIDLQGLRLGLSERMDVVYEQMIHQVGAGHLMEKVSKAERRFLRQPDCSIEEFLADVAEVELQLEKQKSRLEPLLDSQQPSHRLAVFEIKDGIRKLEQKLSDYRGWFADRPPEPEMVLKMRRPLDRG